VDKRALQGVLVLIVDDDADMRELLRAVLERRGAAVVEATSGAEARVWLRDWSPSIVLCDVAMPNEDGLAFIRRLRAEPGPNQDCKAIALSAAEESVLQPKALEAGFHAFVSKGASLDVLSGLVRIIERARDLPWQASGFSSSRPPPAGLSRLEAAAGSAEMS